MDQKDTSKAPQGEFKSLVEDIPKQPQQPPKTQTFHSNVPEVTPQTDLQQPSVKKKASKKMFAILGIFLLLFISLLSGSGVAVAVAYEKLSLSEDIDSKIRHAVLSVPFMPKTPRYVMEKSLLAHQDIKSHSFDASLALESDSFATEFGFSRLDASLVGAIDYQDPENVTFEITTNITKDFAAQVRKIEDNVYIKIDKVPLLVYGFLGIQGDQVNELIKDWVSYDVTPLETSAREVLDENSEKQEGSATNSIVRSTLEELSDEQIINKISVSEEDHEGTPVYKLSYEASEEDLDYFQSKLDENTEPALDDIKLKDIVNKLTVEVKIGRDDNLVGWVSTFIDIKVPQDQLNSFSLATPYAGRVENVNLAFVIKLDDFDQKVNVEVPENTVGFEELWGKALQLATQESSDSAELDVLGVFER